MNVTDQWINLPIPGDWPLKARQSLIAFVEGLCRNSLSVEGSPETQHVGATAACCVLRDLVSQGWQVRLNKDRVAVRPPTVEDDSQNEKERVRRQELLKRDEQLMEPSVRRFITYMEQPREHRGSFVSIFSLMRDGEELAAALAGVAAQAEDHPAVLRRAIDPYIQVVASDMRCEHTGLRLTDIWRYFRHTWTNQYTSTPGRTLPLLVRDRAAPFHPVIGIAALGSSIIQIRERDEWIGWHSDAFLKGLEKQPSLRWARWVMRRLDQGLSELYIDDLLEDGLYWPTLWDDPSADAIAKLRNEAKLRRHDHNRFARRSDFGSLAGEADESVWQARAESDLFRSKRCLVLADLLEARHALLPHLSPSPSLRGLTEALADRDGRRAIADVLRRAKAESVGTEIADLTVCGAVPPYNGLIGGKLVSMLAVSPSAVRAYHERYASYASQIASSLAGRPIRRRSNLVFVGTTALYGSHNSQYNRLRLPASVLKGSSDIVFRRLGKSRSYGTSHLSNDAVSALVRLAEQSRVGMRVNSIFGEGVNPKLRKIREGLELLGWPSDELLRHRRQRIVYGVTLVENLLPYLLGLEGQPRYSFRRNVAEDVDRIAEWWFSRWLRKRAGRPAILEAVREHTLERPVQHGARVALPDRGVDGTSDHEEMTNTSDA